MYRFSLILVFLTVALWGVQGQENTLNAKTIIGFEITDGVASLSGGVLSGLNSISTNVVNLPINTPNLVVNKAFSASVLSVSTTLTTPSVVSTSFDTKSAQFSSATLSALNAATSTVLSLRGTTLSALDNVDVAGNLTVNGTSTITELSATSLTAVDDDVQAKKASFGSNLSVKNSSFITSANATGFVVRDGNTTTQSVDARGATFDSLQTVTFASQFDLGGNLSVSNSNGTAVGMFDVTKSASMFTGLGDGVLGETKVKLNANLKGEVFLASPLTVNGAFVVGGNTRILQDTTVALSTSVSQNLFSIFYFNTTTLSVDGSSTFRSSFVVEDHTSVKLLDVGGQGYVWENLKTNDLLVQGNVVVKEDSEVKNLAGFGALNVTKYLDVDGSAAVVGQGVVSKTAFTADLTSTNEIVVLNTTLINSLPTLQSTSITTVNLTVVDLASFDSLNVTHESLLSGNTSFLRSKVLLPSFLNVNVSSRFFENVRFDDNVTISTILDANDTTFGALQVAKQFRSRYSDAYTMTVANLTVYGFASLNIIEVKKFADNFLTVLGGVRSTDGFIAPFANISLTTTSTLSVAQDLLTNFSTVAFANFINGGTFGTLDASTTDLTVDTLLLSNSTFVAQNTTARQYVLSDGWNQFNFFQATKDGLTTSKLSVISDFSVSNVFISQTSALLAGTTRMASVTVSTNMKLSALESSFLIQMNPRATNIAPFQIDLAAKQFTPRIEGFRVSAVGGVTVGQSGLSRTIIQGYTKFESLEAGTGASNGNPTVIPSVPNLDVDAGLIRFNGVTTLTNTQDSTADVLVVRDVTDTYNHLRVGSVSDPATSTLEINTPKTVITKSIDLFSIENRNDLLTLQELFTSEFFDNGRSAEFVVDYQGQVSSESSRYIYVGGPVLVGSQLGTATPHVSFAVCFTSKFDCLLDPNNSPFWISSTVHLIRNLDIVLDSAVNFIADTAADRDLAPTSYQFRLTSDAFYLLPPLHLTSIEQSITRLSLTSAQPTTTINSRLHTQWTYMTVGTSSTSDYLDARVLLDNSALNNEDLGMILTFFGTETIPTTSAASILTFQITAGNPFSWSTNFLVVDSGVASKAAPPDIDPSKLAQCNANAEPDVFSVSFIVMKPTPASTPTLTLFSYSVESADPTDTC